MQLPPDLAAEAARLAARLGPAARVEAAIPDGLFDPLTKTDRVGEVCMVIRRPGGRLLTFRKDVYPPGVMRLLTGGIGHGEGVEAALLREVAEETSLDVAVRRLLAVIGYRAPSDPPGGHSFYTFAFLLDELGGVLAPQDPEERVEAFGEAEPAQLYALASFLERLDDRYDREIGGSWRSWGAFRAVVHRVVAEQLGAVDQP
jgi:ADP-ribose pyrophosphatase YjhB (NUDIX family)